MKVTFDETENQQGKVEIEVAHEDYWADVDKQIKKYSKTLNLKGFRKGKVPQHVVNKMMGKDLVQDKVSELINKSLSKFFEDQTQHFLGEPKLIDAPKSFEITKEKADFKFTYLVSYVPPFDLELAKNSKITKYKILTDNQLIDDTIFGIRRKSGKIESTQVTAENDLLLGALISKNAETEENIEIDLYLVKKQFSKKLIGIKLGDEIPLNLSNLFEDYNMPLSHLKIDDIKKMGTRTFKLQEIKHYHLAEMTPEFFNSVLQVSTNDENAFRETLKNNMHSHLIHEEEGLFYNIIKKKLIAQNKISLPEAYLYKKYQEKYTDLSKEKLDELVVHWNESLKWQIISDEIQKIEKININDNDILNTAKEVIKKKLLNTQLDEEQLNTFAIQFLKQEDQNNYKQVYDMTVQNKIMQHITLNFKVKEKEISMDEFKQKQYEVANSLAS